MADQDHLDVELIEHPLSSSSSSFSPSPATRGSASAGAAPIPVLRPAASGRYDDDIGSPRARDHSEDVGPKYLRSVTIGGSAANRVFHIEDTAEEQEDDNGDAGGVGLHVGFLEPIGSSRQQSNSHHTVGGGDSSAGDGGVGTAAVGGVGVDGADAVPGARIGSRSNNGMIGATLATVGSGSNLDVKVASGVFQGARLIRMASDFGRQVNDRKVGGAPFRTRSFNSQQQIRQAASVSDRPVELHRLLSRHDEPVGFRAIQHPAQAAQLFASGETGLDVEVVPDQSESYMSLQLAAEEWAAQQELRRRLNQKDKQAAKASLLKACRTGDLIGVKELQAAKLLDVTIRTPLGRTPLMICLFHKHLELANFLLHECGADAKAADKENKTVLMFAAQAGDLNLVQHLLQEEKDDPCKVDSKRGFTAATYAVRAGHLDVFKLFTPYIDVKSAVDKSGTTLVEHAVAQGRDDVLEYLVIECKCAVNFKPVQGGVENLVELAMDLNRISILALFFKHALLTVDLQPNGVSYLFRAARKGQLEVIRFLVETVGTNHDVTGEHHRTPLMEACVNRHLNVAFYLVKELKDRLDTVDASGFPTISYVQKAQFHHLLGYIFASTKRVMTRSNFLTYLTTVSFSHEVLQSSEFYESCLAGVRDNPATLYACLRLVSLFRQLGEAKPAFHGTASNLATRFNLIAVSLWRHVVTNTNDVYASAILEHNDIFEGHLVEASSAIDLALHSENVSFIRDPEIDRIVHLWWTESVLGHHDPSNYFFHLLPRPFFTFKTPKYRFACDAVSYTIYLILVSFMLFQHYDISDAIREVEIVVIVSNILYSGFSHYSNDGYNQIDVVVGLTTLGHFLCRVIKWSDSQVGDVRVAYQLFAIMLSIGVYSRHLFYLTFNSVTGPLILTLRKMLFDIVNFALLMFVLSFGFFFGMNFVIRTEAESTPNSSTLPDDIANSRRTFFSFFQAALTGNPFLFFDQFDWSREIILQVLSTIALLFAGVVLINLLIAMMGSTYSRVHEKSGDEYLYGAIQARRRYDLALKSLPIPLNIIAMILYLCYLPLHFIIGLCLRCAVVKSFLWTPRCVHCHRDYILDPKAFREQVATNNAWKALQPVNWIPPHWIISGNICVCGRAGRSISGHSYVRELISGFLFAILLWLPIVLPGSIFRRWRCHREERDKTHLRSKHLRATQEDDAARHFWSGVFPVAADQRVVTTTLRLKQLDEKLQSTQEQLETIVQAMTHLTNVTLGPKIPPAPPLPESFSPAPSPPPTAAPVAAAAAASVQ